MFRIHLKKFCIYAALGVCLPLFAAVAHGQTTAVLFPDATEKARSFAGLINEVLANRLATSDPDLAAAVLRTQAPERPFNQSTQEARTLGAGIGCHYFVLVRADTLRRVSIETDKYFEAYAAVFVVNAQTGRLIHWDFRSLEAPTPNEAETKLYAAAGPLGVEMASRIEADFSIKAEPEERDAGDMQFETDPETRVPLPYKRIKPVPTDVAKLYGIEATVDIEVAIDAGGSITETRIVRWAGYGLDESVEQTVRAMQWRPADRKGKPFAMRVLLRYNFKDLKNSID